MNSTVTLKDISAFITKGATPTTYGFQWESSGIPFLRSECVSDRGLDLGQSMFISEKADQALRRSQIADGDILLTITGNVGRVVRLSGIGRGNINQHIARVRIKDSRFDSKFVYHYLSQRPVRDHYESIVTGQAYPQISLVQVRDTIIPALPLGSQRAIATALSDADELIAALVRLIGKRQAIKRGMLQRLLTGKTRLPGFTEPWSTTTFGELGTFLKGRGVKRDDVQLSGVPCIRYGELYTTFNDYTASSRSFVTPEVAATALPLRHGDLLFAGSGETREEIGKCVAYVGPKPAVAGGDIVVLRGSRYNPVFLGLLANTPVVAIQKTRAGQGDAIVHINSRALAAISIEVPRKEEQDAIAAVITDVDCALATLREQLTKARMVKQGMMHELLTGRTRLLIEEETA